MDDGPASAKTRVVHISDILRYGQPGSHRDSRWQWRSWMAAQWSSPAAATGRCGCGTWPSAPRPLRRSPVTLAGRARRGLHCPSHAKTQHRSTSGFLRSALPAGASLPRHYRPHRRTHRNGCSVAQHGAPTRCLYMPADRDLGVITIGNHPAGPLAIGSVVGGAGLVGEPEALAGSARIPSSRERLLRAFRHGHQDRASHAASGLARVGGGR